MKSYLVLRWLRAVTAWTSSAVPPRPSLPLKLSCSFYRVGPALLPQRLSYSLIEPRPVAHPPSGPRWGFCGGLHRPKGPLGDKAAIDMGIQLLALRLIRTPSPILGGPLLPRVLNRSFVLTFGVALRASSHLPGIAG